MKVAVLMSLLALGFITGCVPEMIKEPFGTEVPANRKELVTGVQQMLAQKGFDPGPIDGIEGAATRAALREYQRSRGLQVTAGVNEEAYRQLRDGGGSVEQVVDIRECVRNFEKQGLDNYRTSASLPGVSQRNASEKFVRALSRKGFVINEQDFSRGFISATFDAGRSDLIISGFIDRASTGSNVELNYRSDGASIASWFVPSANYRNEMCDFIESMR